MNCHKSKPVSLITNRYPCPPDIRDMMWKDKMAIMARTWTAKILLKHLLFSKCFICVCSGLALFGYIALVVKTNLAGFTRMETHPSQPAVFLCHSENSPASTTDYDKWSIIEESIQETYKNMLSKVTKQKKSVLNTELRNEVLELIIQTMAMQKEINEQESRNREMMLDKILSPARMSYGNVLQTNIYLPKALRRRASSCDQNSVC